MGEFVQKAKIHGHWGEPSLTGPLPLSQNRPSGTTLGDLLLVLLVVSEAFQVVKIDEKIG